MYHTIEFVTNFTMDLEVTARRPLEQLLVRKGTRRKARILPFVVENDDGPTEVADLLFEDGSIARRVRYACFSLVN